MKSCELIDKGLISSSCFEPKSTLSFLRFGFGLRVRSLYDAFLCVLAPGGGGFCDSRKCRNPFRPSRAKSLMFRHWRRAVVFEDFIIELLQLQIGHSGGGRHFHPRNAS